MDIKKFSNLTPWKPGQSGNPAGRPKGSRHALTSNFLKKLHEDFKEHGEQAIALVRENDTSTYLRIIASLVPKEMTLNMGESSVDRLIESVPEDQLAELAEGLASLARIVGTSESESGKGIVDAEFSEVCEEVQPGADTSQTP